MEVVVFFVNQTIDDSTYIMCRTFLPNTNEFGSTALLRYLHFDEDLKYGTKSTVCFTKTVESTLPNVFSHYLTSEHGMLIYVTYQEESTPDRYTQWIL